MIEVIVVLFIISFFYFIYFNCDILDKIYTYSNAVFFIYFILGLVAFTTRNKDISAIFIAFIVYLAIRILYHKYKKKYD